MKNLKKSNALEKISKLIKEEHWRQDAADIAIRILYTLKQKGIKQADLAKKLGKSPQWVNRVCRGSENLTIGSIRRIEQALEISLFEIPELIENPIPLERYTAPIEYRAGYSDGMCTMINLAAEPQMKFGKNYKALNQA